MPVYNGGAYLKAAIDSILDQTFSDFEFLIIEDGSTDDSAATIRSYSDRRITVLSNGENRGLVCSLNRGIENAKGDYIARMDSDDISLPDRLQRQVIFMDGNPDIGLCGSWIETMGEISGYINKYPSDHEDIKANLLFNTSLAHPTVMIRRSVLEENNLRYDESHRFYYEDYGLWIKISRVTKMANIPQVLLRYRLYKKSFSRAYAEENKTGADALRRMQLASLGLNPSDEEIILHNSLQPRSGEPVQGFLDKEAAWLLKIIDANKRSRIYKDRSLEKTIYGRWRTVCGFNAAKDLTAWRAFISSPLFSLGGWRRCFHSLKIFAKCSLSYGRRIF